MEPRPRFCRTKEHGSAIPTAAATRTLQPVARLRQTAAGKWINTATTHRPALALSCLLGTPVPSNTWNRKHVEPQEFVIGQQIGQASHHSCVILPTMLECGFSGTKYAAHTWSTWPREGLPTTTRLRYFPSAHRDLRATCTYAANHASLLFGPEFHA